MPRRQKRLLVAGGVVAAVLVGAGVVWAANQPPAPVAVSVPSPSVAGPSVPTTAGPDPVPTRPVPTQTVPVTEVDNSAPENVVRAWAKAYFSRPTWNDTDYLEAIEPFIDPSLREYMRTDEYNMDRKGYLGPDEGTRVLDVKITPQDGSVGIDTPDRWTRNVTVTVEGLETGKKTDVPYTLTLFKADKPWFIVSAPKKIIMGD